MVILTFIQSGRVLIKFCLLLFEIQDKKKPIIVSKHCDQLFFWPKYLICVSTNVSRRRVCSYAKRYGLSVVFVLAGFDVQYNVSYCVP